MDSELQDWIQRICEGDMKVPFVDLKRTAALIEAPVRAAWQQAVEQTEFVGGPTVKALEAALAPKMGVQQVITCSSGTDALYIGLQALGVGAGDKVAVPNLTFWATYEAVVQLSAIPVLIDVDPETLQMDLRELRAAHDKLRLKAAALVHLMGWATPQLEEFRTYCREAKIALLEDGAQSYGVEVQGRSVYQGAQVSTLSFYPAKVYGGCMDGGAILTDDLALAELLRKLCNHGRSSHYGYSHVGWNSRMGGIQAAWLLELLAKTDSMLEQRRSLDAGYRERLHSLGDSLKLYGPASTVRGNGYLCVCGLKRSTPEEMAKQLAEAGIATGRVYPETLDQQGPARDALRVSELAHSREFCRHVINLPLFYGMNKEELDYVCTVFADLLRKG